MQGNRTFRGFAFRQAHLATGSQAELSGSYPGEKRNGLIAAAMTTQADGRAERDAALLMLHELTRGRSGRITTGADKA